MRSVDGVHAMVRCVVDRLCGRVAYYLGFEKVMQTIHIMHAERSVGNCCEPERSCNTSTLTLFSDDPTVIVSFAEQSFT